MEHNEIASVYFHIGNGGVSFSVLDKGHGPVVKIDSSHFGNNVTSQELYVRPEDLTVLARLFRTAADHEGYSKSYCMAAAAESAKPFELIEDYEPIRGGYACDGCGDCMTTCAEDEEDFLSAVRNMCDEEYDEDGYYSCHCDDSCDAGEYVVNDPPHGDPWAGLNDEYTMCQGDPPGSGACLDIYYASQFVQNERHTDDGESIFSSFLLEHTPVINGTLTGNVYSNEVGNFTFTFIVDSEGNFSFSPTSYRKTGTAEPIGGQILPAQGILNLVWDKAPGRYECLVNYEYDMDLGDK
jgi:ferredoxin